MKIDLIKEVHLNIKIPYFDKLKENLGMNLFAFYGILFLLYIRIHIFMFLLIKFPAQPERLMVF